MTMSWFAAGPFIIPEPRLVRGQSMEASVFARVTDILRVRRLLFWGFKSPFVRSHYGIHSLSSFFTYRHVWQDRRGEWAWGLLAVGSHPRSSYLQRQASPLARASRGESKARPGVASAYGIYQTEMPADRGSVASGAPASLVPRMVDRRAVWILQVVSKIAQNQITHESIAQDRSRRLTRCPCSVFCWLTTVF